MYLLKRLILIDSYKPGTLQEVRLDGHTNLNGVNGAGKTTLLRLIPLFFGERPGRLVPKSRVTESFAKHYLPNESSYIIFEYQRNDQICMTVIYASPNEEGLCYRFVDKGFDSNDFLNKRSDNTLYPVSCRDFKRHFEMLKIQFSNQITSCSDYRTVIQNLPHKKGVELRHLISRYSFCDGSSGRRLKDIEKIISGMLMRSTNFSNLREMLVNCIDENRESIALETKMDTLADWHKEYSAFQKTEAERGKASDLNRLQNDLAQIELDLGELHKRLSYLLNSNNKEKTQQEEIKAINENKLEDIKTEWDKQEQTLKSKLAEIKAELEQSEYQIKTLENERDEWARHDIQTKNLLCSRLDDIKQSLEKEKDEHQKLLAHVQDIDAEFKRRKAEKEKDFDKQHHKFEIQIKNSHTELAESKAKATRETEVKKETLRRNNDKEKDSIHLLISELREQLGVLNGKMAEIQPDPILLTSRDSKIENQHDLLEQKQSVELEIKSIESEQRGNQSKVNNIISERNKQEKKKLIIEEGIKQLHLQLNADENTVIGFLRDKKPEWTTNIAKVINPELLLREDLEPALQEKNNGLYGLNLNLELLTADVAADEESLRVKIAEFEQQLQQLKLVDEEYASQLVSLETEKTKLAKKYKEQELKRGQIQTKLNKLRDELYSLKQQIERSKKDKKNILVQQKKELDEQIKQTESKLNHLKQQLKTDLDRFNNELALNIRTLTTVVSQQIKNSNESIDDLDKLKIKELTQLETHRLKSLAERKVDPETVTDLEAKIESLKSELIKAQKAGQEVEKYQRWLDINWSQYSKRQEKSREFSSLKQETEDQLSTNKNLFLQQREKINQEVNKAQHLITQLDKSIGTINNLLEHLQNYPKQSKQVVSFDQSHTLALLQSNYRKLTEQYKTQRKALVQLISHFKRVLSFSPGTRPASYCAAIETEIGLDGDEKEWLSHILNWYDSRYKEDERFLITQADLFGSTIRNYQQALERFDRGVDSLSRRLATHIDRDLCTNHLA
ncbi:MAG: ATP-binding protein [Methylomarinum sp.]|nr:ATP-binding protein [Methylomarinum sp.]